MIEIRQMTFNEKLRNIQKYEKNIRSYTKSLVKDKLGKERLEELETVWNKNSKTIPPNAKDEEKYEVAYKNYLQTYVIGEHFMAKCQGHFGVAEFNRAAINSMRKTGTTSSNVLAKTMMAVTPKTSFQTIAKELAYRLQVFSPFTVDQLDENQMVLTLTPCKIASNSRDFCNVACQNVIRIWLEAQFNINMVSTIQGPNCTVKITPFNS
jgi:hypothetical protein